MNKKFLSLVLALVMVLGAFTSVFAADTTKTTDMPKLTSNDAKIQWLIDNKIVAGRTVNEDPNKTDLALNSTIQRAEITRLLVFATGEESLAQKMQGSKLIYPDVPVTHWANGYIAVGSTVKSPSNQEHFIHGYEDGYFRPEKAVRYDELAKMLVVLAKEDLNLADAKIAGGRWSDQWMRWATELGILDGINEKDYTKDAVRKDAFVMLYNALYKMGGVKDSRVLPGNQIIGVISKHSDGTTLTLNQGEMKKELKVDKNTVFVQDGTIQGRKWKDILEYGKNYYVGSLVRVLVDKDNTVTHIIELGNPEDGYKNNTGWIGVADKQTETILYNPEKKDPLQFASFESDKITISGNVLYLDGNTRYFVADYDNGILTEVSKADAHKLAGKTPVNVYAGYNTLPTSGRNEAKVIVFNKVNKGKVAEEYVRVVQPGNTAFNLTVENAGWNPTEARALNTYFNRNVFPFNYNLERFDVFKLAKNADAYKGDRYVQRAITHRVDPIYQIVDVKTHQIDGINTSPIGNLESIKLRDKSGYEAWYDIKGNASLFFGAQIEKGAKVQVVFDNKTAPQHTLLEVVSVIPADSNLRGNLPEGRPVNEKQVTAKITEVLPALNGSQYITFVADVYEADGTVMKDQKFQTTEALDSTDVNKVYTFITAPAHSGSPYNFPHASQFKLVEPATPAPQPIPFSVDAIPATRAAFAPITGTAAPGSKVEVFYRQGTSMGTVDPVGADGKWSVTPKKDIRDIEAGEPIKVVETYNGEQTETTVVVPK